MVVSLTVNGTVHSVTAEPDTPLLYVLRNDLGLNAAKFGCGLGQCGACTVLIDGAASRSCAMPIGTLSSPRSSRSKVSGRLNGPTRCSLLSWRSRRRSAATASPA